MKMVICVQKHSGEFDRMLRRCAEADIRIVERLIASETAQNALAISTSNMQFTVSFALRFSPLPDIQ